VVAVSYLVMLGYITFALAALPPPQQLLQLFVLSRAALGAGGVLIVAGALRLGESRSASCKLKHIKSIKHSESPARYMFHCLQIGTWLAWTSGVCNSKR
jgi:hypothetical protein